MDRFRRRGFAYVGLIVGVASVYTVAFKLGMTGFEGRPVTWPQAFHFVVQTFTTTGYGEYAGWEATPMLLLVDLMQVTGVFLIFLTLPLFVVPWVEERLEVEPPASTSATDHVVICGFGARGETLASELDAQGVPYVFLERDRDTALSLHENGQPVVYGDPEKTAALERANIGAARAIVLDEDDERNATVALTVADLAPDVATVCFVEDPSLADYLSYAGADIVLSPREILGRGLAEKVTAAVTPQLGDAVAVGEDFDIVEMPIHHDSDIEGSTLAESDVREQTGVNVIGAWFAGEFASNPDPDRELDRNTILLVAGGEEQLESLKRITLSEGRSRRTERVVVAGHGEVGSTARSVLDSEGIDTTVVDWRDRPGVDIVGDVTEESTLSEAGIEDASAVILALGDDTATVFATLVARQASEDVEIICRANETENAPKLYRAGADYVLTLSTVAGRMLAQTILDEDVMALDKQIDVVRTDAPNFAGQTLAGADIRNRTGATVIAVERNGDVMSNPDADFRIQHGDSLVVVGTDGDIASFTEAAGVAAEPS
jgi:Trk K+ transport system NAD-binding subunit